MIGGLTGRRGMDRGGKRKSTGRRCRGGRGEEGGTGMCGARMQGLVRKEGREEVREVVRLVWKSGRMNGSYQLG